MAEQLLQINGLKVSAEDKEITASSTCARGI